MLRISLVWRLALIVIAAILVIQFAAVGIYYLERRYGANAAVQPRLTEQIASLARYFEQLPSGERETALRTVTQMGLAIRISATSPAADAIGFRLPAVERRIKAELGGPERDLIAHLISGSTTTQEGFRLLKNLFSRRMQVVVPLVGGEYLVIETAGELMARLFGVPAGFLISIAAFIVAGLAILGVARETRPLRRLAASIDSFSTSLAPTSVREQGAPEVRAVIAAVNTMQSRIAALLQNRTLMIGAISHDLRTYLTRLRLRVEAMPDGEHRRRAVRDIEDMQALLEDALAFASAAFVTAPESDVDLRRLIEHECDERAAAGAEIGWTAPHEPVVIRGNAVALARAIGNLIDNAVKYGARAEVALTLTPTQAVITIDDRGPGIPPEERQRVFEPFRRLEDSRNRERGGAGLGLAIARQVAERHGGTITIGDGPAGGARFQLHLARRIPG